MNKDILGLKGKTAVVTGGAVNIGRAISAALAGQGVNVAIVYHSSPDAAEELVGRLRKEGCTAGAFQADVSSPEQVRRLFNEIRKDEDFTPPGILVNNSGILTGIKPQSGLQPEEWDRIFSVNVRGVYLCSQAAASLMKSGGSIINIASINALHPGFGNTAHYDATKAAVWGYTRSLAAELGPRGIRVNAVAPGLVDSEDLRRDVPDLAGMVETRNPLKDTGGTGKLVTASDVADAVLFLASDLASAVTGETVTVDRGYLLT